MKNENEIQMFAMLKWKSPEIKAVYKRIDSVDNLNYNPMEIRFAGLEGIRLSFVAGYKQAAAELIPTIEKLLAAHSAWQCESEYLCALTDAAKSGTESIQAQHELTLLASLSAAADQLAALVKTEPDPSSDD